MPVENPYRDLVPLTAFIVWGPPSHGPRSAEFARGLGIQELHFIGSSLPRTALTAPLRYAGAAAQTLRILAKLHSRVVFVQSPPSPAVLIAYLYCRLTGAIYLVDAHSAALQMRIWTRPAWLHHGLARAALATIVTNDHFKEQIQGWGARAVVIGDVRPRREPDRRSTLEGAFNVAVVGTYSEDEPLPEILAAAGQLPDVHFHVTGNVKRARPEVLALAPVNVRFTGFLPDDEYFALLAGAQAVMCLTTRDNTMQDGACGALSLGTPIITSDWPILRRYFHLGTVHVANTPEGIRAGVEQMIAAHDRYRAEIRELQVEHEREWQRDAARLAGLVRSALRAG